MKRQLRQWIRKIKLIEAVLHLVMRLFACLPVRKNRILFESFLGKQYSDNPRAIYEAFQQEHPEFELLFSKDRRSTFDDSCGSNGGSDDDSLDLSARDITGLDFEQSVAILVI